MNILGSLTPRKLAAYAALSLVVATGTASGVAFAGGGAGGGAATTAPTDKVAARGDANTGAPSSIAAAAQSALARLAADGTIDQTQVDAVEQQVEAGSVDPNALVSSGVVSADKMHAIAQALDQVKSSFAGNP